MRRVFRLPVGQGKRLEAELDEEIRLHLELRVEALMTGGMTRSRAEAEARRRFGVEDRTRTELLDAARKRERRLTMFHHIETLQQDLRYAWRQIRRAPGFALAVTLTFALGIGANATMFGIVDRLLLRAPAHVAAPDDVVLLEAQKTSRSGRTFTNEVFTYPEYLAIRNRTPAFDHVAAFTRPTEASLGLGPEARRIMVVQVSGNYFRALGAPLTLGRPILPDDDLLPTGTPVAVISNGLWQREFRADPDVIGMPVTLSARPFTIVGVAPPEFVGIGTAPVDAWIPISAAGDMRFARGDWTADRNSWWLWLAGRVAAGQEFAVAGAQATTALRTDETEARGTIDTTTVAQLKSIVPSQRGPLTAENRVALLLAAVSVLVLLIACANVANLLLVRAVRRRREIAVRLALGVSRARLMRQLCLEGTVLALTGGAAALAVVFWGSTFVQRILLGEYAWPESPIDTRVLLFTGAATILVGLLAGLAPALHGRALDLTRSLKDGSGGAGRSHSRVRGTLLAVQAAVAVILLIGTGLFVRSLDRASDVKLGIEINRLLLGEIDLSSVGFDSAAIAQYFTRVVDDVARIPQVERAAAAEAAPFSGWSMGLQLYLPGRDSLPRMSGPYRHTVTPGYFATVGTRIVQGRPFIQADAASGAERVVIINEEGARELWPGRSALGECVLIRNRNAPCARVVGVAEDTYRDGIVNSESGTQVYVPMTEGPRMSRAVRLLVRAADGEPARLVAPVRRAMQSVMSGLPYADVRVMSAQLDGELRPWRLGATMFGAFGMVATLLSALGLYSVIAYAVAQRTHEIGVRVALGARTWDISRMILLQGMRLAAAGALAGAVVALWGGRFVDSLLYDVSARDPLVFCGVLALVLTVAAAATLIPARRATRVDPLQALRTE